jgi:hypothetical protein
VDLRVVFPASTRPFQGESSVAIRKQAINRESDKNVLNSNVEHFVVCILLNQCIPFRLSSNIFRISLQNKYKFPRSEGDKLEPR